MFNLPPPGGLQRPLPTAQVPGPVAPFDPRRSPEFRPPQLPAAPQMPGMQLQHVPGFTFADGANMLSRALENLRRCGGVIVNAQPTVTGPGSGPGGGSSLTTAPATHPALAMAAVGPVSSAFTVPDFLTGGWQPKGGFSA